MEFLKNIYSHFLIATGRIYIANNVVYSDGFSGVHTNYARKVDIFYNTAIDNSCTGHGKNCGITVPDISDMNVMNNMAVAENNFGCDACGTDEDNQAGTQIVNSSSLL